MIKKIVVMILALALFPALVFADAELKGTVVKVDKVRNQLVVRTDKGEETLVFAGSTKGMGNAKEGAKVTIKYSEKDGQPRVTEITPQEGGTTPIAPR